MRTRLLPLFAVLAVLAAGCGSDSPARDDDSAARLATLGAAFDAAKTGRVAGRVVWAGPIPDPPPFLFAQPRPDGVGLTYQSPANPNRPRVDPKTRAVAGAVLFLRGIDPAASRPWDLPAVTVEMGAGKITVVQGDRRDRGLRPSRKSFSAKSVERSSHPPARGRRVLQPHAAGPDRRDAALPVRAAWSYRAAADCTGARTYSSRSTLLHGHRRRVGSVWNKSPAGRVEVVAWVPGWDVARQDRNPDTTAVSEMTFTPPVERVALSR